MSEKINLEIVPLTPRYRAAWDAVVQNSEDAWLFHSYDFLMNVVQSTWDFTPLHFMVCYGKETLGIFPLCLQQRARFGIKRKTLSAGFGPASPALVNDLSAQKRNVVLHRMFMHLNTLAAEHDADTFEIASPILAPGNLSPKASRSPNSVPRLLVKIPTLQQFPASAYVLNLKPSETELFANFEKRCRNAISRAEREHFSLRRVSSLAEIKEYYELHKETYRRTGVVPHPYTYFRGIWEQFGKRDIANFFIAERDGQAVAAINIAVFKGNALYWTGCSKTAELHTGINNLLQWNAIRFAKQQGCSWYALGDAFPDARGKLGGLDRFKGSFGAATKQFFKGKITYHPNKERVLGILQLIKQRCTGR